MFLLIHHSQVIDSLGPKGLKSSCTSIQTEKSQYGYSWHVLPSIKAQCRVTPKVLFNNVQGGKFIIVGPFF